MDTRAAVAPPVAETEHMEEELRELRAAIRARDTFLATAAHELRNPMTPILLQIGNLLAAARDPARCRPEVLAPRLEVLDLAVRDFIRRSTALLEVSRLAAGEPPLLAPRPAALDAILRRVLDRADPAARIAGCRLEAELAPGLAIQAGVPSGAAWDPEALELVAESLVSNAIRFGAGHPVRVTLSALEGGGGAVLVVRDQGGGIGAAERERVYGSFEEAAGARREHGGLGLGLWLASRLVAAMGGTLALEGRQGPGPGRGTTATVTLPLQEDGAPPAAAEQQGIGA